MVIQQLTARGVMKPEALYESPFEKVYIFYSPDLLMRLRILVSLKRRKAVYIVAIFQLHLPEYFLFHGFKFIMGYFTFGVALFKDVHSLRICLLTGALGSAIPTLNQPLNQKNDCGND